MKIEFLNLDNYLKLGLKHSNVFGCAAFLRLNASKVRNIVAVVGDRRMGVVFGDKDGRLCSPWSAPYFSLDSALNVTHEEIFEFGKTAREVLKDTSAISIVTPPDIYNGPEKSFFEGFRKQSDNIITDTSFFIPLKAVDREKDWNKSARRNLKRGIAAGLNACITSDIEECYNLISSHHKSLGYNMAMSLNQVKDTASILPIDFWIVKKGALSVAAMYCYHVREDIVQVISSGDTPEGREVGASMFMERSIIDYYRKFLFEEKGLQNAVLDHGPTSVLGIQNEGLAAFKASFGCLMSPKYTLITD